MPPVRLDAASQRRLELRSSIDPISLTTPCHATGPETFTNRLPFSSRLVRRPSRWRTRANKTAPTKRPPTLEDMTTTSLLQKYRQMPDQKSASFEFDNQQREPELRFSFTAETDCPHTPSPSRIPLEKPEATRRAGQFPHQDYDAVERSSPPPQFGPVLSLPRKKREGYGFSYSDTFFQDSFEYPDSDEWEPEETVTPRAKPSPAHATVTHGIPFQPIDCGSTSAQQRSLTDGQASFSQLSFSSTASTVRDDSFNNVVVVRDVGSFHVAMPQKTLACTVATREDTIRLKAQGKLLLEKYAESAQVQEKLLSRLERMVLVEQGRANLYQTEMPSVPCLALRIRDFLLRSQDDRIDTGELPSVVEHEIEWAKWLVEASRKGVMHLKTEGCKCRPDWEDDT